MLNIDSISVADVEDEIIIEPEQHNKLVMACGLLMEWILNSKHAQEFVNHGEIQFLQD